MNGEALSGAKRKGEGKSPSGKDIVYPTVPVTRRNTHVSRRVSHQIPAQMSLIAGASVVHDHYAHGTRNEKRTTAAAGSDTGNAAVIGGISIRGDNGAVWVVVVSVAEIEAVDRREYIILGAGGVESCS